MRSTFHVHNRKFLSLHELVRGFVELRKRPTSVFALFLHIHVVNDDFKEVNCEEENNVNNLIDDLEADNSECSSPTNSLDINYPDMDSGILEEIHENICTFNP